MLNPDIGRFITQDTYLGSERQPWTQHLYAYVGNNPINFVDPTGHSRQAALDPGGGGASEPAKGPVEKPLTIDDGDVQELCEGMESNALWGPACVNHALSRLGYVAWGDETGTITLYPIGPDVSSENGMGASRLVPLLLAIGGVSIGRTPHADIRDAQGRPVSKVINDLQRSRPSDILYQPEG